MINTYSKLRGPKRPYLMMGILFLVFLIPLLAALFMYVTGDTISKTTTNRGQLIQPPRDFKQLTIVNADGSSAGNPFKNHWLLLYVAPKACEQTCQRDLYFMRQIWIATNKNSYRVQRAIMTFASSPADKKLAELLQTTEYQGTQHVIVDRQQFAQLMQGLPSTNLALTSGYIYLVDPLGNIMMAYAPDANPSGILKDLEKLLRVSQIG